MIVADRHPTDVGTAFISAAKQGNLAEVIRILHDPSVNVGAWRRQAIKLAAVSGHRAVIEFIQQATDNPLHAKAMYASTHPLEFAASCGQLAQVERCLSDPTIARAAKSNPVRWHQVKLQALRFAIHYRHPAIVARLLQVVPISANAAEIILETTNTPYPPSVPQTSHNAKAMALGHAVKTGDVARVIRLICKPNFPLSICRKATQLAAANNQRAAVEFIHSLTDRLAPLSLPYSATHQLEFSASCGHLAQVNRHLSNAMTKQLAANDPAAWIEVKIRALRLAMQNNHLPVVKKLIALIPIAALEQAKQLDFKLLYYALHHKHIALAHQLLGQYDIPQKHAQKIADIVIRNRLDSIASILVSDHRIIPKLDLYETVMLALEHGQLTFVRCLINRQRLGSFIESEVLLKTAVTAGHSNLVRYLLSIDSIDPMNNSGELITHACRHGHHECLALLLSHPAVKAGFRLPSRRHSLGWYPPSPLGTNIEKAFFWANHHRNDGTLAMLVDQLCGGGIVATKQWAPNLSFVLRVLKGRHLARRQLLRTYCTLNKHFPKGIAQRVCEFTVLDAKTPLTSQDVRDVSEHIRRYRI